MTSRRGTLVEDGARELLQINGYAVQVIPPGFNKRYPPAHLVATRPSGETRYIRIRKLSHRPSSPETIRVNCAADILRYRRHSSMQIKGTRLRYEIWIYSLTHGFRCFEVLKKSVREIPQFPVYLSASSRSRGAA